MVVVAVGIGLSLLSCAHDQGALSDSQAPLAGKGQKVEAPPQPGDVKMVDGTEFVYARNVRFQTSPYEPEYTWLRKADYAPGAFDSLRGSKAEKDDLGPLRKRIEKLEEDLRRQNQATTAGAAK